MERNPNILVVKVWREGSNGRGTLSGVVEPFFGEIERVHFLNIEEIPEIIRELTD